jgi:2',3'-cyclic-nucleotide 2'-phosphodiesterase (5'-nucleotidase family)
MSRTKKTKAYLPFAKPYITKEVAGVKIGIIGVIWPKTYTIVKAANVEGYDFLSATDTLKELIPKLKAGGAKFIVVLSHNGLDDDKMIAEEVPDINVIVGGHSHSTVKDPVKVKDTLIVQAGCKGKYLGKLDLTLDSETGKILKATEKDELIPIIDKKYHSRPGD